MIMFFILLLFPLPAPWEAEVTSSAFLGAVYQAEVGIRQAEEIQGPAPPGSCCLLDPQSKVLC